MLEDKQIIIDGCDVSGCNELVNECDCYLTEEHDYRSETPYTYNKCSEFPNCHYKNWKRKEQECDMWKNLTVDNGAVALKYQQQLDQLKATNEDLLSIQYKLADNNKRLRQTLDEIKEIADLSITHFDIDYLKQAINEILQKIRGVR